MGKEGKLLIEKFMNPLVQGLYISWIVMINLNVGACVYVVALPDSAAKFYGKLLLELIMTH